jgi:transcriptional regulator with XRE-family HTH domain
MRHWAYRRRHAYGHRPVLRLDTTRPPRNTEQVASRDLKRLADAVVQRRAELGLSQEEFAERAGTGDDRLPIKTLQRVELQKATPRAATLGAIDRAAGWPTGRARTLLDGDQAPAGTATPMAPIDKSTATLADLHREYVYFAKTLAPEDMERLYRLVELYHELQLRFTAQEGGGHSHAEGDR